jgi:hypothetical protein
MRQFRSSYRFWALFALFSALLLTLTACGGGSSSSGGGGSDANKLVISPSTSASLNSGDVGLVTGFVQNSSGNALTDKVSWTSSNTSLVSLATDGTKCGGDTSTNTLCLCAGTWKDNTFIDCTPATTSGTSTLTATSGSFTTSITVFVHPKVARVTISTPVTDCTSSTGTLQATANAFDASGNAVTVGPSDQTGFSFQTSDGNVVTSDTKGLLTAVNPGAASIYAVANNVTSAPAAFSTCGVKKINLHVKDATDTSFTVDSGTGKTLVADVIDTKDKTITIANSRLTFASSNNGIVSVTAAGAVTTSGAGTSTIVAACTPPNCNIGLSSVYSNPVIANVNGSSATTVWVASKSSTSIFPIDTAAGTVGTAFTMTANPNSFISARTGLGGYLGGDSATFLFDASKGPSAGNNFPGKVIAVSNDAGKLVIFDNATNKISVLSFTVSNNVSTLPAFVQFVVPGIPSPCETTDQCPRASFTPDNLTAYIVAGGNLYVASTSSALKTIPLGTAARDVVVSEQGSFTFVANNNSSVDVFATCNRAKLGSNSVALATVPQRIVSSADGTKIYAVTPPSMSIISPSSDFTGCPPSLTDPLASFDMGQGTFTARQLLITSNGAKVIAITDTKILIFNTADNPTATVTLAGGATPTTGDLTLDGKFLFVGGSDSKVHKIDLATNSDATQIAVTISPDFVVVKAK